MPDFRFRLPAIDELTVSQRIAYIQRQSLLITGGPGSGKTVVSIFRYLKQIGEGNRPLFFTFNRTLMSSIRGTLRQRADILLPHLSKDEVEELVIETVGSISEWYWENFKASLKDESEETIRNNFEKHISDRGDSKYFGLFIDEAQDIKLNVISCSYMLGEIVTCGADRAQDLQGHYKEPADEIIFNALNDYAITKRQGLSRNFRNTRQIFEFARQFVPEDITVQEINLEELPDGEHPELYEISEQDQLNLIKQIIEDNPNSNIGILLHTGPQIDIVKKFLEDNDFKCDGSTDENKSFSYYKHNMLVSDRQIMESRLQSPFILTFDSCKGLEFDIVIMPLFDKSTWALATPKKTNNVIDYQANGNPRMYSSRNHYYVAATRARGLLYLMYEVKPEILSFYENRDDILDDLPF